MLNSVPNSESRTKSPARLTTGIAISPPGDLLFVSDIRLVRQATTSASVKFDDAAVAELFDEQVDAGLRPEQFARICVHTHPGDSPHPSSTDEQTFARVFGRSDWAVMFILARGGQTYARLRFNVGPGGAVLIPVSVDYSQPFTGSDHKAWDEEYVRHVAPEFLADVLERTPSIWRGILSRAKAREYSLPAETASNAP